MTASLVVFSAALLSAETQWPPRFQTYEEFAAEWKLAADEWPPFGEWMDQRKRSAHTQGLPDNNADWPLSSLKESFVYDTTRKLRKAHYERLLRCSAIGWVVGAEPPTEKEVRDKAQRLNELRILQRYSAPVSYSAAESAAADVAAKARFSQIIALEKEVRADQERRWCAEQDGADAMQTVVANSGSAVVHSAPAMAEEVRLEPEEDDE